jgi:hypothetical protein
MYYKLLYVFKVDLFLNIFILYVYRSKDIMQYNQQLYAIYFSTL